MPDSKNFSIFSRVYVVTFAPLADEGLLLFTKIEYSVIATLSLPGLRNDAAHELEFFLLLAKSADRILWQVDI